MKSPLGDKPVSNNAKRGTSSTPTERKPAENKDRAGGINVNPAQQPIHISMNNGGMGTAGRKTYPKLGI